MDPSTGEIEAFSYPLELKDEHDLSRVLKTIGPGVHVVRSDELDILRRRSPEATDLGRQKKGQHLARFLVPKKGKKGLGMILLIQGGYKSPGRLRQGIKGLFPSLMKTRSLFIIGTHGQLFDNLKMEVQKKSDKDEPIPDLHTDSVTTGSGLDEFEHDLLRHLKARYPNVPKDLEASYVGVSEAAQLVRYKILVAAETDVPVLIYGDTGTGKEVVARQIHQCDKRRRHHPFKAINCSAIPKELFELELFGCEKDVVQANYPQRIGLWEAAGRGTLFLDEIGDLNIDHQVKILRALEEGCIRRIGGTKDIPVHARIISATNRNLFQMSQAGNFREDLYYRLHGFPIHTPVLRDHPEDIPLIADHFWRKITGGRSSGLSPEVHKELCRYKWPGNSRELKRVLEHVYTLFRTDNPTRRNVQVVFRLAGRLSQENQHQVSGNEIALHRARCLVHLNWSYEVIHACHYKMKHELLKRLRKGESKDELLEEFRFYHHDIDELCQKPLRFHNNQVFSAVYDLKGKIFYLQNLLVRDNEIAAEYLEKDLLRTISDVLKLIFTEIEKVMAEG